MKRPVWIIIGLWLWAGCAAAQGYDSLLYRAHENCRKNPEAALEALQQVEPHFGSMQYIR